MKLTRIPRVRADVEGSFLCKLYACSCVHSLAIQAGTRHSANACEGCDLKHEPNPSLCRCCEWFVGASLERSPQIATATRLIELILTNLLGFRRGRSGSQLI